MNVLALVPSWNSAPRKCKDREKWGALSKVKKMPGCVCSSINPSMPEKLKPAVGYPGNMSAPEELRKYREAQTGGLLRALVCPSPARAPPTYISAPSAECWVPWERLETEDRDSRVRCWNLGNFRLLHFFLEWWNWLRPQIGRTDFSVETNQGERARTHQWDCSALTIL